MNMPVAESMEKSVLSSLMQNEYLEGEETLTEDHFYLSGTRRLFPEVMKSRPFDITAATQRLHEAGTLEDIGGSAFITEVFTYAPTSVYFASHLKKLHDYKARRLALSASLAIQEASQDLSDEEGYLRACSELITGVFDAHSASRAGIRKDQLVKNVLTSIGKKIRGKESPIGITTGLKEIDEKLYGLHQPRIWVISGYPTGGKTVLGLQILWNAALSGTPTLMISLEMPSDQIVNRLMIPVTGLSSMVITDPKQYMELNGYKEMPREKIIQIKEAGDLITKTPIFFEDPSSRSITQVVASIRRYHRKEGVKIVGVDYLQLVEGNARLPRDERIAEISHTVQALAKELKITIILLSQQNDTGATKYSTAVSDDADVILSIAQNRDKDSEEFGKHLGLFIRKDRHGGRTGETIGLYLNKNYLQFTEYPEA